MDSSFEFIEKVYSTSHQIEDGDLCVGRGTIFLKGRLRPEKKNRFLAVSTPGNPKDFSGNR